VRRSIMQRTLSLATAGIAIGVLGALLATPAMAGLLFGVTWNDPASFAAALATLLVVAAIAGSLPAHRAACVDPSMALRDG
jgi:ABC-type antimicrobial peptide transport system permease subunit